MKRILNYILIVFLIGITSSCTSILDLDPTTSYSETSAWSTEKTADLYVTGLYDILRSASTFATPSLSDGYTDLVKYGNSSEQNWSLHNYLLLTPDAITSTNDAWDCWGFYNNIKAENVFLYNAPKYGSKFGDDFLNIRLAEVRFLRAFNYYRLIRCYGGVILRDETDGVDAEAQKNKARATESESWDFVMKDLDFAAEYLPTEWSSDWTGRLTKGCCLCIDVQMCSLCKALGCSN
jgi:hypothetical protein